jgi:hypothetical protein
MAESWNVGRTGKDFQCWLRLINGLLDSEPIGSSGQQFQLNRVPPTNKLSLVSMNRWSYSIAGDQFGEAELDTGANRAAPADCGGAAEERCWSRATRLGLADVALRLEPSRRPRRRSRTRKRAREIAWNKTGTYLAGVLYGDNRRLHERSLSPRRKRAYRVVADVRRR